MKMSFFCTIVILIILFFVSCTHSTTSNPVITPNNDSTGIWPMKVGNEWIYETTIYDSNNVITGKYNDTLKIIKDTILGSEKAFMLESPRAKLAYASPKPYYIRPDGVYADPDGYGTIHLYIKYPAIINEMYFLCQNCGDTTIISSLSQWISTIAGSFNCINYSRRVHIDNNLYRYSLESYFSVGIGKIKEIYGQLPYEKYYGKRVTELVEYHLK
jgi:hypothetical protein